MKHYTQNPELNEQLNKFDQHLQDTLHCDLVEHKYLENLTDGRGLKYTAHFFYIHSAYGDVLIHKLLEELLEETKTFWHREGLDQTASGATYPDGSIIKANTMIVQLKVYHPKSSK